jgi:hypothetical protein
MARPFPEISSKGAEPHICGLYNMSSMVYKGRKSSLEI